MATPSAGAGPSTTDLVPLAQDFVNLLVKGDFESAEARFDATMKEAMPTSKLEETWNALIGQVGAFKQQIGTRTQEAAPYHIVFVTAAFEKANLDIRVVFDDQKQIAGLFFAPAQAAAEYQPPAYAKPSSFTEKGVTVGSGQWALPGTLTVPNGAGPFPAVVLVQGSGPNDRDETVGANKPFKDLAWGLASNGVAVLRYEKRTKQYATQMATMTNSITVKEETVDDAIAAVSLLKATDGIDHAKIFVLGHSLGGLVMPRIGLQVPDATGLIILAGNTRPLEDLILEQTTYIASLQPNLTDADKAKLEDLKKQVARVKDPSLSLSTPASDLPLGIPPAYWLDLRGYKPAEVAAGQKQPTLILQGERDYQVTMADFQGWKDALSSRGNVELKSYPKLNHLFMEGEGKSRPEEYNQPGHVADYVVGDIAGWIKKQ